MNHILCRYVLILGLAVAGWLWNGEIRPTSAGVLVATAEAVIGRPATPVSYAGVARRSTSGSERRVWALFPRSRFGGPGRGYSARSRCCAREPGRTREPGRGALNKALAQVEAD